MKLSSKQGRKNDGKDQELIGICSIEDYGFLCKRNKNGNGIQARPNLRQLINKLQLDGMKMVHTKTFQNQLEKMTKFIKRSSICNIKEDYTKIQDEDIIKFWRDSQAIEWPMVGFSSKEPDVNWNNQRDE